MWMGNKILRIGCLNLCASTIFRLESIKSNKIAKTCTVFMDGGGYCSPEEAKRKLFVFYFSKAMVEGGQGSDAAALARLELLSNTAMLKVMDKKGITLAEHGSYDPNSSMMKPPMQRPPSPREHPGVREESPAGHSHHSYGEDPHQSQRRHGFAPPPHTYQYMRYDHSRDPGSQEAHYMRAESPSGYSRGPHGELYHQESAKTPASMVAHVSSDHLSSAYQRPYGRSIKENVPPYAFRPPTSGYNPHQHLGPMHGRVPEPIYGAPRVSPEMPRPINQGGHMDPHHPSYEVLARDNHLMREQLQEKDTVASSLQQRVNYLERQISELRQLPTGKISHIPVE
jgi:hypothetical protein